MVAQLEPACRLISDLNLEPSQSLHLVGIRRPEPESEGTLAERAMAANGNA